MAEHTPTPWAQDHLSFLRGANGEKVVSGSFGLSIGSTAVWPEAQANADFIVRAVNSHDDLVAFVRDVMAISQSGADTVSFLVELHELAKRACLVLSKAEGL